MLGTFKTLKEILLTHYYGGRAEASVKHIVSGRFLGVKCARQDPKSLHLQQAAYDGAKILIPTRACSRKTPLSVLVGRRPLLLQRSNADMGLQFSQSLRIHQHTLEHARNPIAAPRGSLEVLVSLSGWHEASGPD